MSDPLAGHSRDSIVRGFAALRTVCDPKGYDLLAVLEDEALFLHDAALAFSSPDTYKRVAPDTPGLRLVGAFLCDPDERGGAA